MTYVAVREGAIYSGNFPISKEFRPFLASGRAPRPSLRTGGRSSNLPRRHKAWDRRANIRRRSETGLQTSKTRRIGSAGSFRGGSKAPREGKIYFSKEFKSPNLGSKLPPIPLTAPLISSARPAAIPPYS